MPKKMPNSVGNSAFPSSFDSSHSPPSKSSFLNEKNSLNEKNRLNRFRSPESLGNRPSESLGNRPPESLGNRPPESLGNRPILTLFPPPSSAYVGLLPPPVRLASYPKDNTDSAFVKQCFDSDLIDPKLLHEVLNLKASVVSKPEKIITHETINTLRAEIGKIYKCPIPFAFLGLCSTLQAGGTNSSKGSNVIIKLDSYRFESKTINQVLRKVCKDFTPRQFATYLRNIIFSLSKRYKITGNAYSWLQRVYLGGQNEYPDDKYWASDFQINNLQCPDHIRKALMARYNSKYGYGSKKT